MTQIVVANTKVTYTATDLDGNVGTCEIDIKILGMYNELILSTSILLFDLAVTRKSLFGMSCIPM